MARSTSKKPTKAQIDTAHRHCSNWLYKANLAAERGNAKQEQAYLQKAQYWLDKLNELEGYNS